MYNEWFLKFAPEAFRKTRQETTKRVVETLRITKSLRDLSATVLKNNPSVLSTLRMSTCPPLAVDRLIGLAGASKNLVKKMEKEHILPPRMSPSKLDEDLESLVTVLRRMIDLDLFPWLTGAESADPREISRAATIVADRLCGSVANPILRNAQEQRQLSAVKRWLVNAGYRFSEKGTPFDRMKPGTFSFRINVPAAIDHTASTVNIVVDAAIQPKAAREGDFPLLLEAKSAGDFTNVNKRRKEEGMKVNQLRRAYGQGVNFVLFLCGYFDTGYLGYEAGEGIDWVWEHRIDDLSHFGL